MPTNEIMENTQHQLVPSSHPGEGNTSDPSTLGLVITEDIHVAVEEPSMISAHPPSTELTFHQKVKKMDLPPYSHCFLLCKPVECLCLPVICLGCLTCCIRGDDELCCVWILEPYYLPHHIDDYEGTTTPCERLCACCIVIPLIGWCERT
jgi:hypothetical protein